MRSNKLKIKDESKTITSIEYVANSLSITSGEDASPPPTITSSDNEWTIELEADRKKSDDVANTFNSRSGGSQKEYTNASGDDSPDELNFCYQVKIKFSAASGSGEVTVNLGQGSYRISLTSTMENWWIGGDCIFSQDTARLEYSAGNQIVTLAISGNDLEFKLKWSDTRPASAIKHVFVLMLENHSFDNMLALSGIPGITAATTSNYNSYNGANYYVSGPAPESMPTDPGHEFTDTLEQLAGEGATYQPEGAYPTINNSGFAANYATTTTEGPTPSTDEIGDIMKCFDTESQLPMLYQLASDFVLCDHWFSSLPGPTWPNRFFLHGASSNGLDHSPTDAELTEWETVDGFKYPNGSIFDRMNSANITWHLYHDDNGPIEGEVSQVSAIHGIQMWDVHPVTDLVTALQSADYPYQYTFIEPNYGDIIDGSYSGGSSQHPVDGVAGGETLIQQVYNAIFSSPIWDSSMLIITYDEHGGFYDHVAPGPVTAPNDGSNNSKYNEFGFNFTQYGVRVPAVIVSPYTYGGGVDHTVYDHTSVLATLEYLFGLDPLTDRDAQANALEHLITGNAAADMPRTLERAAPRAPKSESATPPLASESDPVVEGSMLAAFVGTLLKADSGLAKTPEERAAAVKRHQGVNTRGEARAYLREVMARVQAERARRLPQGVD